MSFLKKIALACSASVLLTSCATRIIGILATEEIVTARALGLRTTSSTLILERSSLANIGRVKIFRPTNGTPRLYLEGGNPKNFFGELPNDKTIKLVRSGYSFEVPGRIYTGRRGIARINLRTGPGTNYSIYKTIDGDHVFIILEELNGWFKVQFGEVLVWVSASLIESIDPNYIDYKEAPKKAVVCENCNGDGTYDCQDCDGTLKVDCAPCQGAGRVECLDCKLGKNPCMRCSETGVGQCSNCRGTGMTYCNQCANSNQSKKCTFCSGSKRAKCLSCNGTGVGNCIICDGKKYIICKTCKSYGGFPCLICKGTRQSECQKCVNNPIRFCYYCMGNGKVIDPPANYYEEPCIQNYGEFTLCNYNDFAVEFRFNRTPKYDRTIFNKLIVVVEPRSAKTLKSQDVGGYEYTIYTKVHLSNGFPPLETKSFHLSSCKSISIPTRSPQYEHLSR